MLEDVAVVDERADDVGIAKIHAQPHAGIGQHPAVEVGDVHGIAQEGFVDGNSGPLAQLKVELVDMEIVQLHRAVLDDPVFDVTLPDDDIRSVGLRIERLWRLAVGREKKFGGAIGVARVLLLFGKEKFSNADGCDVADPRPLRLGKRRGLRGQRSLRFARIW